jgi:hypothetical protein
MLRYAVIIIISITMIAPLLIYANETNKAYKDIHLPKKLKRALSAEMNVLQHHMNSLAISVPAGNFKEIADISKKMTQKI